MTVMIGGHSALGNIRVERILYTYPNGVYLSQISALSYVASWNNDWCVEIMADFPKSRARGRGYATTRVLK